MRRVTKHITREILAPMLSALVIVTFLLLTTQILRVGEAAFGYGLNIPDFVAIMALLMPRFFVFALPLSVLVGVLAAIGRLIQDRELLALSASGFSPLGLYPAPIIIGVSASILTLGLTTFGEPLALDSLTRKMATVVENNLAAGLEPGIIHQEIPGVVLHANERDDDGSLRDVFLNLELEAGRATLAAKTAKLEATGGRGIQMHLGDGEMVRTRRPESEIEEPQLDRVRFKTASISLDVAETVGSRARFIGSLDALTILELREFSQSSPHSWERRRANTAFHRRLAMPFACLSLAILGLGMSLLFSNPGAAGKGAGFVGGIAAMVSYYLLLRVSENMAASGVGPAHLLLWAPNIALFLLGVCFIAIGVRK